MEQSDPFVDAGVVAVKVNVALGINMTPLIRRAAPISFGRGRGFVTAPAMPAVTISPSFKLFLTTYCVGFVVVSAWIA
jgi:hypothetical protein